MEGGRGTREIPLEPGVHGVLVSVNTDRAIRRTTDGRVPVESGNEIFDSTPRRVCGPETGAGGTDLVEGSSHSGWRNRPNA